MKVEFDLPETTIRQIKALAVLTGKASNDVTQIVSELISQGLKQKLVEAIGIEPGVMDSPVVMAPAVAAAFARPAVRPMPAQDVTGISAGLGEVDPDAPEGAEPEVIEGLKDMGAVIPAGVGPSEEELNTEMRVENPDEEAKGSAETFGDKILQAHQTRDDGTGLFAEIAGIDPRIAKRKKRLTGSRGKVSAMEHNAREEDPS